MFFSPVRFIPCCARGRALSGATRGIHSTFKHNRKNRCFWTHSRQLEVSMVPEDAPKTEPEHASGPPPRPRRGRRSGRGRRGRGGRGRRPQYSPPPPEGEEPAPPSSEEAPEQVSPEHEPAEAQPEPESEPPPPPPTRPAPAHPASPASIQAAIEQV